MSVFSEEFPHRLGQKQSCPSPQWPCEREQHACVFLRRRQTVCATVFDITVGNTHQRLNSLLGVPETPLENCTVNNFLSVNQCLMLTTVSFS